MAIKYLPVPHQPNTVRAIIDELTGGLSTRTAPHLMPDNYLYVANNVVFYRDGIISKRPGNIFYAQPGGGTGHTGSNSGIQSMFRFYPPQVASEFHPGVTPQLLIQSATNIYLGNDDVGTFTVVASGIGTNANCTYVQMYDPDFIPTATTPLSATGATVAFICDGINPPQQYDGSHLAVPVHTGTSPASAFNTNWLPTDPLGNPITPAYCIDWGYHMVYGGETDDPTALYISDALRPSRFNGYSITDSAAFSYIAYYPDGRDGSLGIITGLAVMGTYLIIFFTAGIVVGINTGAYGATQYQFYRISTRIGCVAPRSIINMGAFVAFYGGDAFYATDAQSLWKLPDELPTVYSNSNKSTRPPLIQSPAIVFGVRHFDQMIWSIDTTGFGVNDSCVVFDMSAQGGWSPGMSRGGAWAIWPATSNTVAGTIAGMPIGAAVDCRGPTDTGQLFWGASNSDVVAEYDRNYTSASAGLCNYSDFGNPIAMEVQAKALYFNMPPGNKVIQGMYIMTYLETLPSPYTINPQPYILRDGVKQLADIPSNATASLTFNVPAGGELYGQGLYGTFLYEQAGATFQQTDKSWFNNIISQSIQPGVTESSRFPFSLIGFIVEAIQDEPSP